MTVSEIQLYQILRAKLGDKGAEELVMFVKSRIKSEIDTGEEMYTTKSDISLVRVDMTEMKSDLLKSIYIVGLIQFLAIVGSVLAIINFTIK